MAAFLNFNILLFVCECVEAKSLMMFVSADGSCQKLLRAMLMKKFPNMMVCDIITALYGGGLLLMFISCRREVDCGAAEGEQSSWRPGSGS